MDEPGELAGLRAYAAMMNALDASRIEPHLSEDFVYESQNVFSALESKQAFMDYIVPKLETVRRGDATVYAEMGRIAAYGRERPCVVLAQYTRENLVAVVLAEAEGGKLTRLDLCIVPPPEHAQRSGEFPR